jgi:hypothetical protein
MRRFNGIPTASPAPDRAVEKQAASSVGDWRTLAASAIDASVMALGLIILVTCLIAMGLPMSVLDRSAAGPIAAVMLFLTALYFVVFGGIVGQTVGEFIVSGGRTCPPARLNLNAVTTRTREAIFRDLYFIERLGQWVGRSLPDHVPGAGEILQKVEGRR